MLVALVDELFAATTPGADAAPCVDTARAAALAQCCRRLMRVI
jgi:hypothetical protein